MRLKAFYGLPNKVIFCKKTLISNQRPNSAIEFNHTIYSKKKTLNIDKNGISDAWKFSRLKKKINFKSREVLLLKLLDKHRGKYGKYDCIVPGSGGKDSCYATHILKYKYGMNPLTVTWPPILRTDYGLKNYLNWIKFCKIKNILPNRDEILMKFLTRESILNLMHPFQSFMIGQKIFPVKIALENRIPLIFYGENEAEHGNNIKDNNTSIRNDKFYTQNIKNTDELYLAGKQIKDLKKIINKSNKYKTDPNGFNLFIPPEINEVKELNLEVHYLGYFIKWIPQETYYYSVENCGFRPRPFRTQGTYSKYNSIDDKIDDLHYYTTFIKFGVGRATYDVSQEIRNDHLNIDEGKKLIKKYDGEFPDLYFDEVMNNLDIEPEYFKLILDKFRSPHLWKIEKKKWKLRHTVNKDGTDD
jgi:N-acetyl sugar amidotransferase